MEHIKTIEGIYLSKESLEAQMSASWQEFRQNETLENPKQPFTKHIVACFELFKEHATKTEVITLNKTSFYLPQQKLFGFVYHYNGYYYVYIPSPLHVLCAHLAGDAYHDTKFSQEQVENAFKSLYPKLPVLRDQQQQKITNGIRIWRNNLNILDSSCNSYVRDINRYYYLRDDNVLNQDYNPDYTRWFLDLVPTPQSLKEIFQRFYNTPKTQIGIKCLEGQNWLNALSDDTRNNYTSNAQDYLQRYTFSQLATQEQKDFLAKILEVCNAGLPLEKAIEQAYKEALSTIKINRLKAIVESPDYAVLRAFSYDHQAQKYTLKDPKALSAREDCFEELLQADKIRANLKPYDPKILSDANRGLWELWEDQGTGEGELVPFKSPVMARNPKADIKEGIVGIDFGTTSSVVVCQEESAHIYPLRIGLGDLTQEIEKIQYENPTIIAFNDLTAFLQAYNAQKGRPKTKWESVKIAHEAKNDMHNSPSHHYNSFFSALKAWAGDKSRKMQILDRQGAHFELKGSLDLSEGDLNPIELYAYYLGLYINNQYNGIFLNYLLSFPVTYELEVREMILESFKKGIAKSLPNALHAQGVLDRLKVEKGASEPAAYAISALEGYGFEPSDEEQVYYGVFDFGGGTTDFDFGLFMEAPEHSRYDYVLEHFGAGGDRYLGGENLLELASFEIFKRNQNLLLKQQIPFTRAAEGQIFAGSEVLLSQSQEARSNTKNLVEKLRPLWEGREFNDEGELALNLFDSHGQEIVGVRLDFSVQEAQELFKERIKRGVDNFFSEFFRATARFFEKKGMLEEGRGINTFHIFLAGNSSKSPLVKELFEAKIAQISEQDANQAQTPISYKLYAPLESADFAKPNGKTGVAFGLVQARKGGSIQVIDSNVEENIRFKYYLGRSKKRKFYTLIDRDHPYNKWVKFLDASESQFEVYYTTQASAANNHLSLTDHAIKKKSLETGVSNPHAFIFIRLVAPSAFEFVVATDEGLADENYLSSVQKVEL
ncbi:hypothetical protein NHP190002_12460 [Helicobacter ailurogastricus]|uniref:molecular chaperone DnaK n=1 Tax=Helicobacter ailurogastricus TaxID=1578720 RepID=UPI00244D7EE5|nr:molecular chaperone DnaK [Helicobacter ailurogastricus]GMB90544.1 hypothetical protein NHP190002_12460 [Helicobacter ailurogastricus]